MEYLPPGVEHKTSYIRHKKSYIRCQTYIYSWTSLFRTRLIRSPHYFEARSKALGFTLPLYTSLVILKPRYFELFFHFPWDFEIAGFDCITYHTSDNKHQSSFRHTDIWHQTSNIIHISHIRLITSDIRHQTSDFWLQTSEMRHLTSDIRHQTSHIKHQTSYIRNNKSDIRH